MQSKLCIVVTEIGALLLPKSEHSRLPKSVHFPLPFTLTNGNDAEEGISKEITEFDAVKLLVPTELYSKNSVGMFELSTLCYFNFEMSKIEIGSTIPLMLSIIFFTRVLDHSGCTIQNFLPDWSVPLTNPSLKVAV